jgi:cytochrome c peroxidase
VTKVNWGICVLFIAALMLRAGPAVAADFSFELSSHCPPGFEKVGETCEFRSLYQLYPSLEAQGVGGLKTGLPEGRDGFSPQSIDLGRYLFFDPVLSKDGSLSCASCHDPDLGFSDGRARSIGVTGEEVGRSAPTLWNVAFLKRLFWDGRASTLEEQMEGPLYAPAEMGTTREDLLSALNESEAYRGLFAQAFPASSQDEIQLQDVYTALAAFESSLISLNSRYDHYAHGYAAALSEQEIAGLNVFRSFVARCAECHTPPLFTNQQIAVIGTPEPEGRPRDVGAAEPSGDSSQRGGFKVPSLRNIALTAPYMHSGRFETLQEAATFYTKGRGHAVPKGEELNLHWHIWEPDLTEVEIDQIVAFLGTLTDESFKPARPARVPSGLPVGGTLAGPKEDLQDVPE